MNFLSGKKPALPNNVLSSSIKPTSQNLRVTYNLGEESGFYEYVFVQELLKRNIMEITSLSYTSDNAMPLDAIANCKIIFKKEGIQLTKDTFVKEFDFYSIVASYKDIPFFVRHTGGNSIFCEIGTTNKNHLSDITKIIREHFPERKLLQSISYDVNFWYSSANGPKCCSREFTEQILTDIIDNYNDEDKKIIEGLKNYKPKKGGELLLLTGEAGVGKTSLLLSMFREWKHWATFNYIMDPQTFFGGNAAYLLDLILNKDDGGTAPLSWDEAKETLTKGEDLEHKWRIFILEDCGEMLGIDAKEKLGPALSLFLNVTEGFVGRGTKTIIILTTNEEINKLHPAVARPGRCVFRHKFGRLSKEESIDWLYKKYKGKKSASNIKTLIEGEKTLAELYAILNDAKNTKQQETKHIGF